MTADIIPFTSNLNHALRLATSALLQKRKAEALGHLAVALALANRHDATAIPSIQAALTYARRIRPATHLAALPK